MFEYTRNYLLQHIEGNHSLKQPTTDIYPKQTSLSNKQWEILNHFLKQLYAFMSQQMFSVEQKAACLNICEALFIDSFGKKFSIEQSKDRLQKQLDNVSRIRPGNVSVLLDTAHRNKLQQYISGAFFSIYQYYSTAYVEYIDYNIVSEKQPWSQLIGQNKLVQGKVIADPTKVLCLSQIVGERKQPEQPKPKKK